MACTPGDRPDTAASPSLQGAGGKTAICNRLRTERHQQQALEQRLSHTSLAGRLVPGVMLIALGGASAGQLYAQSREHEAQNARDRVRELDGMITAQGCHPQDSTVKEQSEEERQRSDGIYKGRGQTQSWCLTPAIELDVDHGRVTGSFWEGTGGASSTVTGNFTPDGVLQLQFDGADSANFTADIDVGYKDGVIDFVLPAAKQCTYTFNLKKEAPGSSGGGSGGARRP